MTASVRFASSHFVPTSLEVMPLGPDHSEYCDVGLAGTNTFRLDSPTVACWSPYIPAVQFKAGQLSRNDAANFQLYNTRYSMPELLYSDWVAPAPEVQPLMALVQKLAP